MLKVRFKIIDIPDNAKQYEEGTNPYIEMFEKSRAKEIQQRQMPCTSRSVAQESLQRNNIEEKATSHASSSNNKLLKALSNKMDKNLNLN